MHDLLKLTNACHAHQCCKGQVSLTATSLRMILASISPLFPLSRRINSNWRLC